MKKLYFLAFLLFVGLVGQAKPKIFFNYHVFYTPEGQPYLTSIMQFDGGSVKYVGNESGNLVAQVEITHIFKQNDSIALVDKYLLTSPEMIDSTVEDFYDQRNYALEAGVYTYELIIKDRISGDEVSGMQPIKVDAFHEGGITFSSIEFIQDAHQTTDKNNFTKNGFFILPYLTNYYPPETDKVAFYLEIYNTDKVLGTDTDYLLTYSVTDRKTLKQVDGIFKFHRLKSSTVTPVIGYLPIQALPSGNYDINFSVINKENDTVFKDVSYFERRNDIPLYEPINFESLQIDETFISSVPRDSMPYYLQSLMPISPRFEYESILKLLKQNDTTKMQEYFYAFWIETDPQQPEKAWLDYRAQLYVCEKLFGTQIKYCFETDRGRIYLQYGAPNDVVDRPNEAGSLPYQIWRYYRIGQRSDVRFVFYNPDLVTNDYPLLHSELPGEIQNYRWQTLLLDQNPQSVDDNGSGDVYYGGASNRYFVNP